MLTPTRLLVAAESTRVLILEENGIFAVISAMIHHLLHPEVQARGCEALRELAKHRTAFVPTSRA